MTYLIVIALGLGMFFGHFMNDFTLNLFSNISMYGLFLLVFCAGIDIGYSKEVFKDLKSMGFKILLVPFSTVLGSFISGMICFLILDIALNESLAISSGYGWYSLSAVLITNMGSPKAGAISFLSNIMREVFAIILIPILAKYFNHITAIAPAGATSMDSTLPIISKSTDKKTSVIAFINGALLSALVPIVVPFFYNVFK